MRRLQNMQTKTCTKCKKDLPISEFHKSNRHLSGIANVCKNCEAKRSKEKAIKKKARKDSEIMYPETKTCFRCKKELSRDNFAKCRVNKDGLSASCKKCQSKFSKGLKQRYKQRKESDIDYPDYKKCTSCNKILPKENFHKNKGIKNGLAVYCKDCVSNNSKIIRANHLSRPLSEINIPETKICPCCEEEKHYTEFASDRSSSNGLTSHCKVCVSQYRKNNPLIKRSNDHKRRALKIGNGGSFTKEQIQDLHASQAQECFYCGCNISESFHIDHYMPISKGGSSDISNIVLACPTCNLRKRNKLPEAFIKQLNKEYYILYNKLVKNSIQLQEN